ncbi:MAG: hypothetical protein JWQ87_162 [Candidatus Sulfotelmatobacter sp.]|nr:hypothetical protein [Candidatus Sulfotelmatobacter sp.]
MLFEKDHDVLAYVAGLQEWDMEYDPKKRMARVNDLYLSIGICFAAGLILAFALGYLLGRLR